MKFSTRLLAALLVAILALSFVACHKPNETVMTVGDTAIPSGLYLAFQLRGYNELMEGVYTQLETTSATSEITTYADYFNYTYEDKTAEQYIYDYADKMAVEYALVNQKFQEYGLELTKEETDYIDSYAEYYWEQQDKLFYEPSGVGFETYKELTAFNTKKSMIFSYYYDEKNEETGKGGLYTVAKKDLIAELDKSYILADYMSVSLTPTTSDGQAAGTYTDDQIADLKAKFDGYAEKINKGELFNNIYKEYTGSAPQTTVTSSEEGPNTKLSTTATVFSAQDADTSMYDLLKAKKDEKDFAYGKAYVVGGKDVGYYYLVILYDIASDEYYLEQTRSSILYTLKDEEFTQKLAEEGKALTVTKDNGLVKYYKPTNIDFDKIVSENAQ